MSDAPVPSPCIRQCTLDDQEMCLGCYRTLDEIVAWASLDDAARRQVLQQADVRRQLAVSAQGRDA